jgi:hypothetical protein
LTLGALLALAAGPPTEAELDSCLNGTNPYKSCEGPGQVLRDRATPEETRKQLQEKLEGLCAKKADSPACYALADAAWLQDRNKGFTQFEKVCRSGNSDVALAACGQLGGKLRYEGDLAGARKFYSLYCEKRAKTSKKRRVKKGQSACLDEMMSG